MKILIFGLSLLLVACASDPFDLNNQSNLGLTCSSDAQTEPDWQACFEKAKQVCGTLKPTRVAQFSPTGSGLPTDAYFMAFQCH